MSRRIARENALLALYSFTLRDEKDVIKCRPKRTYDWSKSSVNIPHDDYDFALELYDKSVEQVGEIDGIIKEYSTNWDIERISVIDRNILRFAIAEILFFSDIDGRITINEAVELAKEYGGEDSPRFVNGILDAVVRKVFGAVE